MLGGAARPYKGLKVSNGSLGTVEKAFSAWKVQQGEQQGAARLGSRWPRSSKARLAALRHVLGGAARPYKGLKVPNVSFGTVEKTFWAWKAQQGEQQGAARLGSRVATVQQGR